MGAACGWKALVMKSAKNRWRKNPFGRAVLRGLGVVLPPLLTIVIFIWIGSTVQYRVLEPIEGVARRVLTWYHDPFLESPPAGAVATFEEGTSQPIFRIDGKDYVQVSDGGMLVERYVFDRARRNPGVEPLITAEDYYHRFLSLTTLKRVVVLPMFLSVFVLLLYFLGKFFAAGVGRILWNLFEQIIQRIPIIRNVYGSVKQVTDFIFSDQEIEFNRVVALEYPRKGVWSLGFVTGESMLDIRSAANEPVLSVLMPTSPMPATGFTITIRKSETIDLNITIDQAIQFVVSCGVVVPSSQLQSGEDVAEMVTQSIENPPQSVRSATHSTLTQGVTPGENTSSDSQVDSSAPPADSNSRPKEPGTEAKKRGFFGKRDNV